MLLDDRYQRKIKTAQEIRDIVGERPRVSRVIMCHGVFDVVHPGHVRHLLYAKSRADILIASLTADQHISKGVGRPHVPQELRAMNLTAFEAVDYVLIDNNADPLENIRLIQPDLFAKGFEYSNGAAAKTNLEAEVLHSYGGELIFTPGDVVYSSTALIETSRPSLKLAKLDMLMDRFGITFDNLRHTIDDMANYKVHVVGDTIVDSYSHCSLTGGHAKTPTISVLFDNKVDFAGGAAVVSKHLAAAGADVTFSTVLGDDTFADFVWEDVTAAGVHLEAITDLSRPTVNKNAYVTNGYRILKVDTLDNSSITDDVLGDLVTAIKQVSTDAVVFSDFRHGIFNHRTIPALTMAIPEDVLRVADSQVASRWGNIIDFQGFDLITPNEREARFALGDQELGVRPLASKLYDMAHCKVLILKMGERGAFTCSSSDHESLDSFFVMDSFAERVVDPVGAGDALLAYATLAMLASEGDPGISTILGSIAAAIECEYDGNVPVTADDVRNRLDLIERQMT